MGKIILIHGLYMHGLVMQHMARRFKKLGYHTICLSYNTVKIKEDALFKAIDAAIGEGERCFLVGHSLGGVMIKRYLESRNLSEAIVPKVAIVGSPINGARIVERVNHIRLGRLLGNAPSHGLEPTEGVWDHPQKVISIAGNINIGIGLVLLGKEDGSDGTVTIEETKIEGMTEHCILKCNHTSLIYSSDTVTRIHEFFQSN